MIVSNENPKPYNPFLADIYSLGIVFCEILFGFGKKFNSISNEEKDRI